VIGGTGDPKPPWYLDSEENPRVYELVLQLVRERAIMPLETVWLTRRGGFGSALEEGMKNLRSKRDFQALIDVSLARQKQVTPIPIRDER
jgi:hypothetical protein